MDYVNKQNRAKGCKCWYIDFKCSTIYNNPKAVAFKTKIGATKVEIDSAVSNAIKNKT